MVSRNAGEGEVVEIALRRYDMGQTGSQKRNWRTRQTKPQPQPLSQRKRRVLRLPGRRESLEEIC